MYTDTLKSGKQVLHSPADISRNKFTNRHIFVVRKK